MCCLRLTHVRYRQNAFMQSQYKSHNFGSRVKIPIGKLNWDNISEGNSFRFFHYTQNNVHYIVYEIVKMSTFLKYLYLYNILIFFLKT